MKVYRSKKAGFQIRKTYDELIKAWGVPVEQKDVPTIFGTTHVNICGDPKGEPLVLFHGVGDDSALMWVYNAKALASQFRLYAIDTMGGPGKSEPNENYNKDFKDEEWIDEVLNFLHLDKVNLAGVSNGSYLCQYYTLVRPERVNKTLCMAGIVPAASSKNHLSKMAKIFLPEALFPTKKNVEKLLRKMTGKNSAAFIDNPILLEHFTALMKGFNNQAMFNHKIKAFTNEDIDAIRGKCKYFIGTVDPFAILGGKELHDQYHMDTVYFEETGHGINHEQASVVNEMMLEYFSQP